MYRAAQAGQRLGLEGAAVATVMLTHVHVHVHGFVLTGVSCAEMIHFLSSKTSVAYFPQAWLALAFQHSPIVNVMEMVGDKLYNHL